ncbi:MAG TPA: hypothetical protein VFO29_04915 [Candidatus Rubrimentiphilum sp.]|nr:hypothetical protein [Candidatus Rubrimentiphilum sp.]
MLLFRVAVLAFCGLLLGVPVARASSSDVPQRLREALQTLAAEHHGLIGFHRHYVVTQRAPGHNEDDANDSGRLRDDGRLVWAHRYSGNAGGKQYTADDIAKVNAQLDKKPPGEDVDVPLSPDALAEYRLAPAACSSCAPGSIAFSFTSSKRDANHNDGMYIIDGRTGRLTQIVCHPAVLPKDADSGTITVTFGRVTPDLWSVVEVRQHWTGHVLFIHGSRDVVSAYSNYRRFSSLDQAHKSILAGI